MAKREPDGHADGLNYARRIKKIYIESWTRENVKRRETAATQIMKNTRKNVEFSKERPELVEIDYLHVICFNGDTPERKNAKEKTRKITKCEKRGALIESFLNFGEFERFWKIFATAVDFFRIFSRFFFSGAGV